MTWSFQFEESGPPLAEQDIAAFERELGTSLPGDYREFLLSKNGGFPARKIGLRWRGKIWELAYFKELGSSEDEGLRGSIGQLREDFNLRGFVTIAYTSESCDVCLSLGENRGAICMVEYHHVDEAPRLSKVSRLAGSFSEFCDLIFPIPDIFCPVFKLGKTGTRRDLEAYLTEGGDLNAIGKHGDTILSESIKFRNWEMFDACLERGAVLWNALNIAVMNKQMPSDA